MLCDPSPVSKYLRSVIVAEPPRGCDVEAGTPSPLSLKYAGTVRWCSAAEAAGGSATAEQTEEEEDNLA